MTKKRYLRVLLTGDIKDTVTGELIRGSKIGDLLNELYEENKELKKELGLFKPIIFETEDGSTTLYEKEDFE